MEYYPSIKSDKKYNWESIFFLFANHLQLLPTIQTLMLHRIAKLSRRRRKGQGNGKNTQNIIPEKEKILLFG